MSTWFPQSGVLLTCVATALAADDLLVADFEGTNYGTWEVVGEAFGPGPARGTLPNQMPVEGFLGRGLVNSYYQGDRSTGTLRSTEFTLERKHLQFLIGGGQHPGRACMNLRIGGKVVRSATGPNDKPGGTERLDWHSWDISEFAGQRAILEIVDQVTGGWGHINIDHIVQTDRRLPGWRTNAQRTLTLTQRFLLFPVKNGAVKRLVSLSVAGKLERQFEIELAEEAPDWWAFLEIVPFRGQSAVISVDKLPELSTVLERIEQSDALKGAGDLYRESLRPQFHFSARRGWINDPNGLVFYDGEYHLFFQHNPYGWNWGNMHWGHAVSRDLVHWEELGEALYPDAQGTMFSGSAVTDWANTAGFGDGNRPPLICIYTAAGGTSAQSQGRPFTQGLAHSRDRGRTWTKYAQNPVLPHLVGGNRDPKVFWFAPEKKWVMALYLARSDFALFSSRDLKQWTRLSDVRIEGTSECPEFFELPVTGSGGGTRWIFYGGNGRYLIGRFDGRQFTPESGPHPLHHGNCFYASQTYNDLPEADGRRILVAWGQVNLPGMPFNQMMDFPVELTLRNTDDGLRLHVLPVRELELLRDARRQLINVRLDPNALPLRDPGGELLELDCEIELGQAQQLSLQVRGVPITYDVRGEQLKCLDKQAPLKRQAGSLRLRLLVDRASIEIYANDGRVYMPMGVVLDPAKRTVELQANGGPAQLRSLTVHELRSAW